MYFQLQTSARYLLTLQVINYECAATDCSTAKLGVTERLASSTDVEIACLPNLHIDKHYEFPVVWTILSLCIDGRALHGPTYDSPSCPEWSQNFSTPPAGKISTSSDSFWHHWFLYSDVVKQNHASLSCGYRQNCRWIELDIKLLWRVNKPHFISLQFDESVSDLQWLSCKTSVKRTSLGRWSCDDQSQPLVIPDQPVFPTEF